MKHIIAKANRTWRALRPDRNANVALTFGIAVIPVIALVGAAVDYSRASSARVALQAALDSAALMLSKEAAGLNSDQMNQKANDYFKALFNRPEAKNIQLTTTYTASTSTLVMNATGSLDTALIRVIGQKSMDIGSSATVKWANDRLRVALALDNTGSMLEAGKLDALKTATTNLLNSLKAAATTNGDVYVSIVPFSKNVNIGKSNVNASWIDWTMWDATFASSSNSNAVRDLGGGQYCYQGIIYYWNGSTATVVGTCSTSQSAVDHSSWNGCVMDRGTVAAPGTSAGYDQKPDPPITGNTATLFPAAVDNTCPAELMRLSYDWTVLNQKVQNMIATGTTNQPIGLVWAWQTLVGGGPITVPAKDPNYIYNQVIILLSDGLNTQNRWYADQASIDARMMNPADGSGTCDNIKKSGITIYAVQVNTGGDPVSTLLQKCASSGKFFHLTAANQMIATFNQIGTDIAKLRIAK